MLNFTLTPNTPKYCSCIFSVLNQNLSTLKVGSQLVGGRVNFGVRLPNSTKDRTGIDVYMMDSLKVEFRTMSSGVTFYEFITYKKAQ